MTMSTEQAPATEPVAPAKAAADNAATENAAETASETQAETGAETAPDAAASVPKTPLAQLTTRLRDVTKKAGHSEMWGVDLSTDSAHAPTQVVLVKFLRANNNNVAAAEKQLTSALEWRHKMQPGKLVSEAFDKNKFEDVGFVTVHHDAKEDRETVITWNIYGAVKDNKATFGNVQDFIRWRTALMELGVQKLRLNEIKEPLALDAPDPHQMVQVHDYLSVSFFRMDPAVKAASKETIETFSMAYPELLAHKYFVNVPAIMGWMFGVMKVFLAPATLRKFHPMASGTTLATELKDISASLPNEYGGQGPSVKEGQTVKLVDLAPETEEPTEADTAPLAEVPAAGPEPKPAGPEAEASNEKETAA
ncbi:CRAL/TRIO domain protein [Metarhizium album ARSEF 1941]|uniref:Phosphatidylinositol transfer protein SFH5 n=1 Tax=Metarhizium album (strain ARSEF 1941) TaxID=1081103 RepID=A0A0B2X298_METAS|nr:CRAL/TRIO domain protein [Metarhizium album ARSEF 1941]KHO00374.1 CRAL/TRIO domain protein [Metarhizium album ARSEF 1941]